MAPRDTEAIPEEPLVPRTRCCCCASLFPSLSAWSPHSTSWWTRGIGVFKKLREWSEIVAGPKWKTFIRRFNRNRHHHHRSTSGGKFQYDPLSYALNFDEGQRGPAFDELDDFRDFSSRYAAVSASGKPLNMDAANFNVKQVAVIS